MTHTKNDIVYKNRDRQNLGKPYLMPEFINVFMRSLPGQMSEGFRMAALTLATTARDDIRVSQRRGDVQAIRVIVLNNTIADIERDVVSVSANGVDMISNYPLAYYSPLFDSYLDKREYVTIPQNSTINFSVNREFGLGTVQVYLVLYYSALNVLPPASDTIDR